jgi:hypothetical protein
MYQNPVLFPQFSNREDFLVTLSIWDDDLGQPIDLSGRTLANPGDFTGSTWTVTAGGIVTSSVPPIIFTPAPGWTIISSSSVSTLTIKDYPFGNEMQAISLLVGAGLAILPGEPVTIADPTGKNTMTGYVTSYAPATGALVAQIGSAFEFEIRSHHHSDGYGDGYGSSSFIGTDDFSSPILSAQLGNGISVVDIGKIQLRIPAARFATLRHKTYGAAMTMFDGADTRQMFLGKLPVLFGGVTTMPIPASTQNPYGLP